MNPLHKSCLLAVISAPLLFLPACSNNGPADEAVDIRIAGKIAVPAPDAKAVAIVAAANAFLQTLTAEQQEAVVFPFADNAQRARWSNFPAGIFERAGLARGDLTAQQRAALDRLLEEVLSVRGVRNLKLQIAADDALAGQGGSNGPSPNFGNHYYYVAFLGRPATDQPWMLQFGGHHLAVNATFVGPRASFSPMLTGGQPMTVSFEGQEVYITQEEVGAARALLASLSPQQKQVAIRGAEAIQVVSGPGEFGTTIAPEGIRGSALNAGQKELLLALVSARVGQFNERDAASKMAQTRAVIDDLYFAWFGPEQPFGAAYHRVTGPDLLIEYSPQKMGDDDPTEHTHNMYRDPRNDYGSKWIAAQR